MAKTKAQQAAEAKAELVAKAVELELGAKEDLEALEVKDLEELLKDSEPPAPPAEAKADDTKEEPKEDDIVPEATKEAPPERKAGVTTVADLQRAGRIKVAK